MRAPARRVFLALSVVLAGCSDDSSNDSSGGSRPPAPVTVEGTVLGGDPVAGASIAFVDAASVAASGSLQPLEDLAPGSPLQAITDGSGRFSLAVTPGRYFVLVTPPAGDLTHLPGGELARRSIEISSEGGAPIQVNLSETPSAAATYVGTSRCRGCHSSIATPHGKTLHAVGLRKLGPAGPESSPLQDISGYPDANAGLSYYADGNPLDNTGPGDGLGYRIAGAGYNVVLGQDGAGFFQAIESLDGTMTSQHLTIELTYGGEGLFRQLFLTRLDATGAYASDPAQASRYVLPGEFSETRGDPGRPREVTAPGWVLHEPESWAPPAVGGGPPSATPGLTGSFDARCAGCHFNGMSLSRSADGLFQAQAVPDTGGTLDYSGDGKLEELNVGCESCHGPGSEHVARPGRVIVHPGRLAPGSAGLVCGRCHIRGSGNGTIDGEGGSEYASRNGPAGVELPRSGVGPAEFFGQPDGGGILPSFGTQGGFLNPIDLRQDANSWKDSAGGFGARRDHSRGSMQHFLDHARSAHASNQSALLACWDCHEPHARPNPAQLKEPATNNVLCLRCHAGKGDYAQVTPAMVDALASTGTSAPELSSATHEHVKLKTFDLVEVSMNLAPDVYANPGGGDQLGRCITCHMPKTARSGSWIVDDEGFVIRGDISSHSFDNVSPATSEAMSGAGLDPVPSSCVECHRGTLRGAWPDYRFKGQ